jgi:hypothetical protein
VGRVSVQRSAALLPSRRLFCVPLFKNLFVPTSRRVRFGKTIFLRRIACALPPAGAVAVELSSHFQEFWLGSFEIFWSRMVMSRLAFGYVGKE